MRTVLIGVVGCLMAACAGQEASVVTPDDAKVQDLYIVDCLLPGQVRQLGNSNYLTPRRPISTTAVECRTRGGEYVAYDRADYKTALKVWMPAAEGGDADAQNTVGEIFERGLGTQPNYVVAAHWFEMAATQGHKGAQFNLGTLYEAGNGVEQNRIEALNWYRRAWGLSDDSLVYRSDDERDMIARAQENIRQTQGSLEQQEENLRRREQRVSQREQSALSETVQETAEPEVEISGQQQATATQQVAGVVGSPGTARELSNAGKNFGRYYALVIGNSDYRHFDNLVTPVSDVHRIGKLLENQYGFSVQTLTNGDDTSVLRAINQLNETLKENDNLLIYYSGYGNRRQAGSYESGYWLPVNAEQPPNDTFWVPTEQVSGHLARLKAKRILVVADSSFSGLLADNPGFLLVSSRENLLSEAYIQLRFPNKSRLLLASGQDSPLLSSGSTDSSVFTSAFIAALEDNRGVLTAPALFLNMLDHLDDNEQNLDPEFKAIKRAGDEVGDFFFVAI